jgi:hypothetical protein
MRETSENQTTDQPQEEECVWIVSVIRSNAGDENLMNADRKIEKSLHFFDLSNVQLCALSDIEGIIEKKANQRFVSQSTFFVAWIA